MTAVWAAAGLGLLTAISPCPLATNLAAVSFLGRHADSPRRSLHASLAYVLGRTLCYALLCGLLVGGLVAAARTSGVLTRYLGLIVGPLLVVAGGVLLRLIPLPSFGVSGEALGQKLAGRGDLPGAFALGGLFALSFCPSSAAFFFGSLVPLATREHSYVWVPLAYGIATGLPVLLFAVALATGSHAMKRAFERLRALDVWMRTLAGIAMLLIGAWLCVTINLGL